MPKLICIICAEDLRKTYQFKQQCERNDKILKELLMQNDDATHDNEVDDGSYEESDDGPIKCRIKSDNLNINELQTCVLCKQIVKDVPMETHMNLCHQDTTHVCCVCNKQFKHLKLLKKHTRVHR